MIVKAGVVVVCLVVLLACEMEPLTTNKTTKTAALMEMEWNEKKGRRREATEERLEKTKERPKNIIIIIIMIVIFIVLVGMICP